ncbi:MAG: PilZ domain-containing protein [Pseudomonadota bacterium]
MSAEERRKFTRVTCEGSGCFAISVKVTSGDATVCSDNVGNISLGGIFVGSGAAFPPQTQCLMEIELVGPASLLRILVEGDVVWSSGEGMAVKFTKTDVDSLIHLKHLIRIQSGDPGTVDREYFKELLQV